MKKIFLLSIVILLSVNFTEAQSWTTVSQIPSKADIWTLSAVDQNTVWVSGGIPANLYLSTNGGQTWQLRNTGINGTIWAISALDSMNCWAGTDAGSVYHTSNGGISWTQQIADTGSFINGIKMFDANNGVFYGDPIDSAQPYQFRFTTDGGTNWNLASNAPIAGNEWGKINAWDWTDKNYFWFGTVNASVNARTSKIYHTTTGFNGSFYSTNVVGTPRANRVQWAGIAFTDSLHGMAGSTFGNAIRTTDGGKTWSATNPPLKFYFLTLNMNGLKDGSNLIRIFLLDTLNHCHIFKTTDFGDTWREEIVPEQVNILGINDMQFLDGDIGFGAGLNGFLYKYTTTTDVANTDNINPVNYSLFQNFPNPFNPTTIISYSIPKSNIVTIKVYDILGREVTTLVNGYKQTGRYRVEFNAADLSSGIYFYRIKAGSFNQVRKMILLR